MSTLGVHAMLAGMATDIEDAYRVRAMTRMAERVDKTGPPSPYTGTPCWTWTRGRVPDGYGVLHLGGKTWGAHRLAYVLAHGPIEDGMFVLHRCHNPACCNPDHLRQGTLRENVDDMLAAGRQAVGDRSSSRMHPESRPRGENNSAAKLTEADVLEIRAARDRGESGLSLARRFGVGHGVIYRAANRRTWRHVQ